MSIRYTYSIQNNFLNSKVDSSRFSEEIIDSTVTGTLDYVNTSGDICDVYFVSPLSNEEETTLSGLAATHKGETLFSMTEMVAGEDLGVPKAVYISGSDEVKLAKADSESTIPCMGFTTSTTTSGERVIIQTNDVLGGFTGLTPATEYYVSQTSAGEVTTTKPSSGIVIRIGVAKNNSEMDVHILRLSSSTASPAFSNYQYVESDGLSSITGTIALQEKLRLDVVDLPLGTYRIGWNFDWLYSNTNNSFQARIEMDDYFVFIYMMTQEPQDSDNEYNESGFNILTTFSGTHHFDLDYRTLNSSHTAKILQARMEIWRIT